MAAVSIMGSSTLLERTHREAHVPTSRALCVYELWSCAVRVMCGAKWLSQLP